MNNVKFEFDRGTTYSRDFTIEGYNHDINAIYFTVKENENDKRAVLCKKLNNGITLVDETNASRTYNLLIKCVDTNDLKVNKEYYFDVRVVSYLPTGDIRKTLFKGTMTLGANITQPCNEI